MYLRKPNAVVVRIFFGNLDPQAVADSSFVTGQRMTTDEVWTQPLSRR